MKQFNKMMIAAAFVAMFGSASAITINKLAKELKQDSALLKQLLDENGTTQNYRKHLTEENETFLRSKVKASKKRDRSDSEDIQQPNNQLVLIPGETVRDVYTSDLVRQDFLNKKKKDSTVKNQKSSVKDLNDLENLLNEGSSSQVVSYEKMNQEQLESELKKAINSFNYTKAVTIIKTLSITACLGYTAIYGIMVAIGLKGPAARALLAIAGVIATPFLVKNFFFGKKDDKDKEDKDKGGNAGASVSVIK